MGCVPTLVSHYELYVLAAEAVADAWTGDVVVLLTVSSELLKLVMWK